MFPFCPCRLMAVAVDPKKEAQKYDSPLLPEECFSPSVHPKFGWLWLWLCAAAPRQTFRLLQVATASPPHHLTAIALAKSPPQQFPQASPSSSSQATL
ncbi:hypothetical protein U1Q18_012445 [Sarracenia purpurea var. burkii]